MRLHSQGQQLPLSELGLLQGRRLLRREQRASEGRKGEPKKEMERLGMEENREEEEQLE
ncbi:hypothetical protein CRG98_048971, partial [Punica granatum]